MNLHELVPENGVEGVVVMSGGEIGHTTIERSGDIFRVRYESGWWVEYLADGVRPVAGYIYRKDGTTEPVPGGEKRNIVAFEQISYQEAKVKYAGLTDGFHP